MKSLIERGQSTTTILGPHPYLLMNVLTPLKISVDLPETIQAECFATNHFARTDLPVKIDQYQHQQT